MEQVTLECLYIFKCIQRQSALHCRVAEGTVHQDGLQVVLDQPPLELYYEVLVFVNRSFLVSIILYCIYTIYCLEVCIFRIYVCLYVCLLNILKHKSYINLKKSILCLYIFYHNSHVPTCLALYSDLTLCTPSLARP